jgi:hypothetical protein
MFWYRDRGLSPAVQTVRSRVVSFEAAQAAAVSDPFSP